MLVLSNHVLVLSNHVLVLSNHVLVLSNHVLVILLTTQGAKRCSTSMASEHLYSEMTEMVAASPAASPHTSPQGGIMVRGAKTGAPSPMFSPRIERRINANTCNGGSGNMVRAGTNVTNASTFLRPTNNNYRRRKKVSIRAGVCFPSFL